MPSWFAFYGLRDDGILQLICLTCQNVFAAHASDRQATLHGLFSIFWVGRGMTAAGEGCERRCQPLSFRDGAQHQTSDAQLRIGESRDSGFDAAHRPGMTESNGLRRFANEKRGDGEQGAHKGRPYALSFP